MGAGPGGAGAAGARARAFRRARLHSLWVRILRVVLPVFAVAALGLYFVEARLRIGIGNGTASADAVQLSGDDLKMVNPRFEGFTDDKGRYVVTAKGARQDLQHTDLVNLETVQARLTQPDSSWANVTANKGRYSTKSQVLVLAGNIVMTTSDGMRAKLSVAEVDTRKQRLFSRQPVLVETANGTVRSQEMEVLAEERRVVFTRQVVAHLTPSQPETVATPETAAAGQLAAAASMSDGPVDITSDVLEIRDNDKLAHFRGSVSAIQKGSTLRARELRVRYRGDAGFGVGSGEGAKAVDTSAQPTTAPATEVERIEALGGVEITDAAGRKVTGETSLYERSAQRMTISGGVTVSEGESTLQGDVMIVDLARSITSFPPGKRVRGYFAGSGTAADSGRGKERRKAKAKPADATAAQISGFAADDGRPTEIEADRLDVYDAKGLAQFRGDVVAIRGEHRIKARQMDIAYGGGAAAGVTGMGGALNRIEAREDVVLSAPGDQVVTGDWLHYDATKQLITIGGDVVVSQSGNVIRGDKLVVDLASGRSQFDTGQAAEAGGKKRVKMLITRTGEILDAQGKAGSGTLPAVSPSQ